MSISLSSMIQKATYRESQKTKISHALVGGKSWWNLGLPNGSGIGFPKQEEVLVIIPDDNLIVTSLTAV